MSSSEPRGQERAIVLSDLHIGCGNQLTNFHDHEALARFIDVIAARTAAEGCGFELVLAGDVFDFLQSADYDGFEPTRAVEYFKAILGEPSTRLVMGALQRFVEDSRNTLSCLSGNHDPELLVDGVRCLFEEEVGRAVIWADDQPLLPANGDRWPVWGRGLAAGRIWVLHGDRWDPVNAAHRSAYRAAAIANQAAVLPSGSNLVLRVLNRLKTQGYPWIDSLKPEAAVLALLFYFEPEAVRAYLRDEHNVVAAVLRGRIRASLRTGELFGADDGFGLDHEPKGELSDSHFVDRFFALLGRVLRGAQDEGADPESLVLDLISTNARMLGPETLAEHGGGWRKYLRSLLARLASTHATVGLETEDDLSRVIPDAVPGRVRLVVMGHTHSPRSFRLGSGQYYLNTGTWIPVGNVPPGDVLQSVVSLGEGCEWPTWVPRTFAELEWNSCEEEGTLQGQLYRVVPGSVQQEPLSPRIVI